MLTDKRNSPTAFSVMTINLRFGLADDGPNSWIHRKVSYPGLFAAYRPDFIGMQEANPFQVDYLSDLLPDYDFIGQRNPAPPGWQDNVIFFHRKWNCVLRHRFFLSHTPNVPSRLPKSKWPRQCVMGVFENEGKSLACINTHFDFETAVQVESANIILEMLKLKKINQASVLMGDFNAEPHSEGYRIFTAPENCDPPFMDILSGNFSNTFHGFTGDDKGGHIDWMLYRSNIRAVEKKIIRDRFEGFYPSDHFPVIASFAWLEDG